MPCRDDGLVGVGGEVERAEEEDGWEDHGGHDGWDERPGVLRLDYSHVDGCVVVIGGAYEVVEEVDWGYDAETEFLGGEGE